MLERDLPLDERLRKRRYKRAIVHFGAPKCGSTYLQQTLDRQREILLRDSSVLYALGEWQPRFGSYFCEQPADYIFNALEGNLSDQEIFVHDSAYMAELEKYLLSKAPCADLIFSYEGFGDLPEAALYRMQAYLRNFCEEVVALFYIRSPASYARSAISQRAKNGMPLYDAPSALVYPAKTYIGKALSTFGKDSVFVRSYHALNDGDIFKDFCAFLGLEREATSDDGVLFPDGNKSLSHHGVRLCEEISTHLSQKGIMLTPTQFYSAIGQVAERLTGQPPEIPGHIIPLLNRVWVEHDSFLREEFGICFEGFGEASPASEAHSAGMGEAGYTEQLVNVVVEQLWRYFPLEIKRKHGSAQPRGDSSLVPWARGDVAPRHRQGAMIEMSFEFELMMNVSYLEAGIHIIDSHDTLVYGANTTSLQKPLGSFPRGRHSLTYMVMADLPFGTYTVGFTLTDCSKAVPTDIYWCQANCTFEIEASGDQDFVGCCNLPCVIVSDSQSHDTRYFDREH